MKVKKRTKMSRARGHTTHGWGFRQRHRGHGSKGGKGMAGTGKRGDQKKQKALMMAKKAGVEYFGKKGFTSRSTAKKVNKVMNLDDVRKKFGEGKIGKGGGVGRINLEGYKILGRGDGFKGEIVAAEASKVAIEKMEKAGGGIVVEEEIVEKKEKVKKEEKSKEKEKENAN